MFDRLRPVEFARCLAGSETAFRAAYAGKVLLCVEVGGGDGDELEVGLLGGDVDTGSVPVQAMAFHTVASHPVFKAMGAPRVGFSSTDFVKRLALGRHLVVPLAKGTAQSMSMDRISVGRAHNKDLVLRDPSVSKFHGWFELNPGGAVRIADAGSTNGVEINGETIPSKELVDVHDGDRVSFGSVGVLVCQAMLLWESCHGTWERAAG